VVFAEHGDDAVGFAKLVGSQNHGFVTI
jgi:hypothetical protein